MMIQRLLLLHNQDHPAQNTGWVKGVGRDRWTPTPESTGRKVVPQTPPRFILGDLYSHLGIQGPLSKHDAFRGSQRAGTQELQAKGSGLGRRWDLLACTSPLYAGACRVYSLGLLSTLGKPVNICFSACPPSAWQVTTREWSRLGQRAAPPLLRHSSLS